MKNNSVLQCHYLNNSLILKVFLMSVLLLTSLSVFAFGGGGSSRTRAIYERHSGVNAIGVHFNGKGQADIIPCDLKPNDCASGEVMETECACVPATEGQTCTSHTTAQCGVGYYCRFSSPLETGKKGDGVCEPITQAENLITPTKTYLMSSANLNWWSAQSWCIGNKMHSLTEAIANKPLNSFYGNEAGNGPLYQFWGQEIEFWSGYKVDNSYNGWLVSAFYGFEAISELDVAAFACALCEE